MPITGRIIDLEGKPVPGASLRVLQINASPHENLDRWLEAAKDRKKGCSIELEQEHLSRETIAVSPSVTTDAAGRFRLTGIGRDRLVLAQLDGPTIVTQYLHILTRPGKAIELLEVEGHPDYREPRSRGHLLRMPTSSTRLAPCKPIVGVVRDRETRKPLAGVTIRSYMLATRPHYVGGYRPDHHRRRGSLPADGHAQGPGQPDHGRPGRRPAVSRPCPGLCPTPPAWLPVTVDVALRRGVWIEGQDHRQGDGEAGSGERGILLRVQQSEPELLSRLRRRGPAL